MIEKVNTDCSLIPYTEKRRKEIEEKKREKELKKIWKERKVSSWCSDFSKNNNACMLCTKIIRVIPSSRLVRCNWIKRGRVDVIKAQQNLFEVN